MRALLFCMVIFLSLSTVEAKVLIANIGWNLLGNDNDFSTNELNQSCVDLAWQYNNGNWSAYSSKEAVAQQIMQSDVEKFSQIQGGTGFWVKSNSNNCIIDTLATADVTHTRIDINSSYSGQTACPDIGLDPTKGTIHYVCDCDVNADADCVVGDDINDGLSISSPWQSYEKARSEFSLLGIGDSIAFCKGGSFTTENSSRWVNTQCTASEPCVLRDYTADWASGDEEYPIINASANGFSFEDSGNANHEEGVAVLNLNIVGNGGGNGIYFYNDIDDVEMCNLFIKDFSIGVYLAGSNTPDSDSDGKNSRITLRNSQIVDNDDQGWLGSGDGTVIAYNTFKNNGFSRKIRSHNIYYGSHHLVKDSQIIGNTLFKSAIVDGKCSGASLVSHGIMENLLIAGNTVEEEIGAVEAGCWGIAVDQGGYAEDESFKNVVIKDNYVKNVGNVAIGLSNCQDCVLENNLIVQRQTMAGYAIAVPDRSSDVADLPLNNVTIRNNTVVNSQDASVIGIKMGGEGTGHIVVSNAIVSEGSSITCLDLPLDNSSYLMVDNNLCYASTNITWESSLSLDLPQWQNSSGFDLNSTFANPLFVDTVNDDFKTNNSNSPLINNGHPSLSSSTSITQSDRGTDADIGAYELK